MTDTVEKACSYNLDHQQILKLIPHRYPMLLVDRAENVIPFESGIGIKNVTFNEPFFQGHFPGHPVMPGVLIVEALAQTAGIVVAQGLDPSAERLVYFLAIDEARFRQPVIPGQQLQLCVQKIQNRRNIWKFKGEALVDGKIHAEAICTAMVGER
ncbi:MAG: 3-hydroxyacyl-ACP dehydratase FabZ [Candidatus Paracaedimonas acanthamoebae]|uniref:3-hydroxyacyl-[acyl-carrier-protein] dehydratase FabZ n=1 Tax=Candidatus Paracaedimonas acanthamoebae TaxID=244581 RepID=A0A8J7Q1F0_9PROT|nr:3-hydroxyacyl-ACP dehydratase FabZ [Candidatus Paracaedimonas acanthamoebae]